MEQKKVKDIMIPVDDYALVDEKATLRDAIFALYLSQQNIQKNMQHYRAVLVVDKNKEIIGKVGHLAFLKALEPKYQTNKDVEKLFNANLSPEFINNIMDNYHFWEDDFYDICERINNIKVKDIMQVQNEFIDENATLFEAMHMIIMLQSLSLLVKKNNKVTGIIRLSDIYNEIEQVVIVNCNFKKI